MQMRTTEILPGAETRGRDDPAEAFAYTVSVVIPCLDEAETIAECLRQRLPRRARGRARRLHRDGRRRPDLRLRRDPAFRARARRRRAGRDRKPYAPHPARRDAAVE